MKKSYVCRLKSLITVIIIAILFSVLGGTGTVFALSLELTQLTGVNSEGWINSGYFRRGASSGSGTGQFDPFLRIGKDQGVSTGYNTDGTVQFQTKAGKWTHSIELSTIPTVQIGSLNYYELILDAAEPPAAGKSDLFLNIFDLYLLDKGDYDNYPTDFPTTNRKYTFEGDQHVPPYDSIKLDNMAQGQGSLDMYAYIPVTKFAGTINKYLYLYSDLGNADSNFSEWGAKTAPPVPEPASMALLGLGLLGVGAFKRKKGRKKKI